MTDRPNGPYWVRRAEGDASQGRWEIMHWEGQWFRAHTDARLSAEELAVVGSRILSPDERAVMTAGAVPYMPAYPDERREGIERESPEWFVANMARLVHGDDPDEGTTDRSQDSTVLDNMIAWARIVEQKHTGQPPERTPT